MQGLQLPRNGVPVTHYSPQQLSRRYGLETTHPFLMLEDPLATELEEFKHWSTGKMRMDRPAAYKACATETHQKSQTVLLLYIGFMKNIEKVCQCHPPTVLSCPNPILPCLYFARRRAMFPCG